MTTLTLDRETDQGISENSSLDNVVAYGEMLCLAVEKVTKALIEASSYALLIKRTVNIAPTSENLNERKELKKQRREMEEAYGWKTSLINSYANIGERLPENIANLCLLDFDTVKSLCREKFQPILERLQCEPLTIVEVREEMKSINKSLKRATNEPIKLFEWRRDKSGNRNAIIQLDAEVGDEFEGELNQYGEPLPLFMREMLRRFKSSEVRLPLKSDIVQEQPDTTTSVEPVGDTWQNAQDELASYVEGQVKHSDEITELLNKLQHLNYIISNYNPPKDASERMIVRSAIDDREEIERKLAVIQSVIATPS